MSRATTALRYFSTKSTTSRVSGVSSTSVLGITFRAHAVSARRDRARRGRFIVAPDAQTVILRGLFPAARPGRRLGHGGGREFPRCRAAEQTVSRHALTWEVSADRGAAARAPR